MNTRCKRMSEIFIKIVGNRWNINEKRQFYLIPNNRDNIPLLLLLLLSLLLSAFPGSRWSRRSSALAARSSAASQRAFSRSKASCNWATRVSKSLIWGLSTGGVVSGDTVLPGTGAGVTRSSNPTSTRAGIGIRQPLGSVVAPKSTKTAFLRRMVAGDTLQRAAAWASPTVGEFGDSMPPY